MKRKKTNWSQVPWTPFEACVIDDNIANQMDRPVAILRNSRYQVSVYTRQATPGAEQMFGDMVHLSFKVHDKQAHHDWRDMQRIKNEICGPEYDAVEIYPAESKLVDSANQYHLFVFKTFKLPFGFQERLVGDASWQQSKQRPFPKDARPADCMTAEVYDAALAAAIAKKRQMPIRVTVTATGEHECLDCGRIYPVADTPVECIDDCPGYRNAEERSRHDATV